MSDKGYKIPWFFFFFVSHDTEIQKNWIPTVKCINNGSGLGVS